MEWIQQLVLVIEETKKGKSRGTKRGTQHLQILDDPKSIETEKCRKSEHAGKDSRNHVCT